MMRALPLALLLLACAPTSDSCPPVGAEIVTLAAGDLVAEIATTGLGGIRSLRHGDAEAVSGACGENAAANPEHLVAVAHSDPRNWMEPRGDGWVLEQLDAQTAVLARPALQLLRSPQAATTNGKNPFPERRRRRSGKRVPHDLPVDAGARRTGKRADG